MDKKFWSTVVIKTYNKGVSIKIRENIISESGDAEIIDIILIVTNVKEAFTK